MTDPWQAVPAAELPGGDVGGTGVAVQHNVGSLGVSHKVKLPTHCGVTPGCKTAGPTLTSMLNSRRQHT